MPQRRGEFLTYSGTLHPIEPNHLIVWQLVLRQDSHLRRPDTPAIVTMSLEDELRRQMLIWTSTTRGEMCDHV